MNISIGSIKEALCKSFTVQATQNSGFSVVTPMKYEDGDSIVIFISKRNEVGFRIDDNGEAAFRLDQTNTSLESSKVSQWMSNIASLFGVEWDAADEELYVNVLNPADLSSKIMLVAECSAQMQALANVTSATSSESFKTKIVSILSDLAKESSVEFLENVPIVPDHQVNVDLLFDLEKPVGIVIASSRERLLEAELIWALKKNDPTEIIAVVEDPDKIGSKQFNRALYYTDKVFPYKGMTERFVSVMAEKLSH